MSLQVKQFPLEEEYKKHSNIRPADIKKLRDWMKTQPHLPEEHITDLDLIIGYHCCDRSMEVTKQVLDLHYTFRTHSILFKNRHLYQNTLDNLKTVLPLPMKQRAHDGSAMLYARLIDYDVKNFNFCECIRSLEILVDMFQFEEGTWPGFHLLVDLDQVTVSHLTRLDFETMQQTFFFLQEGMLLKIKGLHFLNAPSFMDRVMFLIKPFLKKHLLELLHIHQPGLKTLEQHLPVASLPRDAGGEGMSFQEASSYIIQKVKDNRPFIEQEMKKRVDESRRPGKPKTISDIFGGIEGSFKKLEID